MGDSRFLPARVPQRVFGRYDVHLAEGIRETLSIHRGQVAGAQQRAKERVLCLVIVDGHLEPAKDDGLTIILGEKKERIDT